MAVQLTRKAVILSKLEGTYGVNAAPGAANGILVNNGVDVTPTGEKVKRDIVRGTFSPAGSVIGAKKIGFKASVELRGGGLDGSNDPLPPDCDPLLLACGMQKTSVVRVTVDSVADFVIGETITGGTSAATGALYHIDGTDTLVLSGVVGSFGAEILTGGTSAASGTLHHIDGTDTLVLSGVVGSFGAEILTGGTSGADAAATANVKGIEYRPATKSPVDQDSATVLFHKDNILYTVVGARGSFTLNCAVNKYPLFEFSMTGLWTDPADSVPSTPTLSKIVPPMFMGANLVMDDYTPVLTELSLNLGNNLADRLDANSAEGLIGVVITGREPTGSLNPEMDSLANFNPWTKWKSATPARIACLIGSDPGNRIRLETPQAQYEDVKHSERSGLAAYGLNFVMNAHRDAGDDEFRMTSF